MTADDIEVMSAEQAFRLRPGLFFHSVPADAEFLSHVVSGLLSWALHRATREPGPGGLRATLTISDDLAFTVSDDQVTAFDPLNAPGVDGDQSFVRLVGPEVAPVAAISARTRVEIWRDGRGFRQDLHGLTPTAPPEPFVAPAGAGTVAQFYLDAQYVGSERSLPAEFSSIDLHGAHCCDDSPTTGFVAIRDARNPNHPVVTALR